MKVAFALALAGATLAAGTTLIAAGNGLAAVPAPVRTALSDLQAPQAALTLADGSDEDERSFASSEDNGGEGGDDCDDDEDGDEGCTSEPAGNAAAAGTAAPPKNGLFTSGTAPLVKSN